MSTEHKKPTKDEQVQLVHEMALMAQTINWLDLALLMNSASNSIMIDQNSKAGKAKLLMYSFVFIMKLKMETLNLSALQVADGMVAEMNMSELLKNASRQ